MTAVGVTALPAIAITTSDTMLNYCIGLVIAGAVSFIATFIMGIRSFIRHHAQLCEPCTGGNAEDGLRGWLCRQR